MSLAWVAGSVRARLLLGRRLDADAARQLGRSESLAGALALLSGTTYAEAGGTDSLEQAQRAVAARLVLHLRVASLLARRHTGLTSRRAAGEAQRGGPLLAAVSPQADDVDVVAADAAPVPRRAAMS
jgi:hypothetical protein